MKRGRAAAARREREAGSGTAFGTSVRVPVVKVEPAGNCPEIFVPSVTVVEKVRSEPVPLA